MRERYTRTLALLPRAAEIADAVYIYDNSADFVKPTLQIVIESDSLFAVAENAKEWVRKYLVDPLRQRENELNGTYKGPVLFQTAYYLAQFDESSSQALVHDRLMLDTAQVSLANAPPAYSLKEILTIQYSQANAPKIERH